MKQTIKIILSWFLFMKIPVFLLIILSGCTKDDPIPIDPVTKEYCWSCEFIHLKTLVKTGKEIRDTMTYYPCNRTQDEIKQYEQDNSLFWENLNEKNQWFVTCTKL